MTPIKNPALEFQLNAYGIEDKELGLRMARYVHSITTNEFFDSRNERITQNTKMSYGRQSMIEFMQFLNIDGKQSYVNIDWTPPMIAPKFMEVLLGGFMKRGEKPRCTAIDPVSIKKKKIAKDISEFRMLEPELSKTSDEVFGRYKNRETFEPESYDELDIFYNTDYRTPEEILMERGSSTVLHNCNWNDIKRNLLVSVRDCGYGVTYTRPNHDGSITVEFIQAVDFFSSYSDRNDLSDASVMGHRKFLKIYDLRRMFPSLSEDDLFEIAKNSKDCPDPYSMRWKNEYTNAAARPYDEYSIEVLFFESKTVKSSYWVERDKDDKKYVSKKKGRPTDLGDDKNLIERFMQVIYAGVYLPQTKRLLKFEPLKHTIRSSDPTEIAKAHYSYAVHMHDNVGMKNLPLSERIAASVRSVTLTHLKIQQLVAKMRPAGILVDISGLKEVDLGTGTMQPLELQRVYDQTGNQYYNSVDEDGERKDVPIKELTNAGGVAQIQALIEVYNFYINKIRDEVGINEYREGSSVNPKTGLGVIETQIRESNNATDFVYETYLEIAEQTLMRVGILLHDSVVYGGKAYREYFDGLDLKDTFFDFKMEMLPDDKERAYVEQMINMALQEKSILPADAFKIRRVENTKLQEIMFIRAQNKKVQQDQMIAQQNSEMNAQIQERSAAAKAQMDDQIEQSKAKMKSLLGEQEAKNKKSENLQKFVHDVLMESFKSGRPLEGYVKDIVDGYFESMAQEQQAEAMAEQQMAEEEAAASLAEQGIDPTQIQ